MESNTDSIITISTERPNAYPAFSTMRFDEIAGYLHETFSNNVSCMQTTQNGGIQNKLIQNTSPLNLAKACYQIGYRPLHEPVMTHSTKNVR